VSDGKVVNLPGASTGLVGITIADLTLAATHLAVAKAIQVITVTPAPLVADARVQDLAYRLGYARGLLESANDLLAQAVQKAAPGAVPVPPGTGGAARA